MKKIIIAFIFLCFAINANANDIDEQLNMLEQRINEITNKNEQLTHEYEVLSKKLDSLAEELNSRIKKLEDSKISPEPKLSPAKDMVEKPANPQMAKAKFDAAFQLIAEEKYAEAEQAFIEFIKKYPTNEYTGSAYYWLGETYALRKKYDKAAINYIQSFNKFPKNSKADISMLKLAITLNQLGKNKEACLTLTKLNVRAKLLSPALQKLLKKESAKITCK